MHNDALVKCEEADFENKNVFNTLLWKKADLLSIYELFKSKIASGEKYSNRDIGKFKIFRIFKIFFQGF